MKIDDRLIIGFLIFIVLVAGILGTFVQGKMDREKKIKDITEIDCNKKYDENKCKDGKKIQVDGKLKVEEVIDENTNNTWIRVSSI